MSLTRNIQNNSLLPEFPFYSKSRPTLDCKLFITNELFGNLFDSCGCRCPVN